MFNKKSIFKIALIAISSAKLIAMILIAAGLLTSCSMSINGFNGITASNNIVTKDISNADFSKIEVIGSPKVEYSQSENGKCKVSVTGPDNIITLLNIRIENGTLKVSYKENTNINLSGKTLMIYASSPSISEATLRGSGDIIFNTNILCENLDLQLSGSGDITTKSIKCNNLDAALSGSGDIKLNFQTFANSASLKVSGSGDMTVRELAAKTVYARLDGSGDLEISQVLANDIYTKLSGSGDIKIKGIKATGLDASLSGSGDMKLNGDVQSCALNLRNSGAISADKLHSENTIANLSGSGYISCHATNTVATTINGSGNISVSGKPHNVKSSGKKAPSMKD